jgi:hypothetical protein
MLLIRVPEVSGLNPISVVVTGVIIIIIIICPTSQRNEAKTSY